jgi:hypothetical protein
MEAGRFKVLHPLYPTWFVSNRIATLGAASDTSLNFRFRRNCQHPRAGDGTTLFVTLWEFEVKSGSEELFERTYGPDGAWAQLALRSKELIRRDAQYRGTRLLRDVGAARVYVTTTDSWESRKAYEEFREKFAAEYAELDRICEGLTAGEKHLSEYET